MSTGNTSPSDAAVTEAIQENQPENAPALSIGQQLRAAREARKLSVAEIAAKLKLTQRQVESLESDEQTNLPGAIVRGFVRNYARQVELDPAPLMQRMDQELQPKSAKLEISVGARVPDESSSAHRRDWLRVVSGMLVLALAALAYFFPPMNWWQSMLDTLNSLSNLRPSINAPAPEQSQEKTEPPPPPAAAAETVKAEPPPAAPAPAPAEVVAPVVPPPPPPPAPPPAATRAVLQFSFAKGSWVEVRDRSGEIIHSQLHLAGTAREVEGRPPFALVVGNASQVTLHYRGKLVDLSKRSKEDVARITLE